MINETGTRQASRPGWPLPDETTLKVSGRWCYLYRAMDRGGNFHDSTLSQHRFPAVRASLPRCFLDGTVKKPVRLTTDKHPAQKEGDWVDRRSVDVCRQIQYLNNCLVQDHRAIKQHFYLMLVSGRFDSPAGSARLSTNCAIT